MASVWACSIDYSGVTVSLNSGGNPDPLAYTYRIEFHAVAQPLLDPLPALNPAVDYGHFVVSIGLLNDGTSSMGIQMQQDTDEIKPLAWPGFFEAPSIFGTAAQFTNGGTLTMIKDYDGDLFTATSPLGSISFPLSDLDPFLGGFPSYRNLYPLLPQGYGAEFTLANPTGGFPAYAVDYVTKFSNIVAKENDIAFQTVPLTLASPGSFWPDNGIAFLPGTGAVSPVLAPYWTQTQELGDDKLEGKVTIANFDTPGYRIFDFFRNRTANAPTSLDLASQPEFNLTWGAWITSGDMKAIMVRRSDSDGHRWATFEAARTTDTMQSVSLQVWAGSVFVCYYNATLGSSERIVSYDTGLSWSAPVPVPIVGTNPRLVVDLHGRQYYFFLTGGNLALRRSFDGGATLFDAANILVATGVPVQEFAALMAADGRLLIAYADAGMNWVTRQSLDNGASWGIV